MTTKEMALLIGKTGYLLTNEGLKVRVMIMDVKERWGEVRVQITPTDGHGMAWVSKSRVPLEPAVPA